MRKVALVLAGGFCGTLARCLISAPLLALAAPILPGSRTGFPYDILLINLSGALAIGLLYGLAEHIRSIAPDVRLALGTGFLGAYTTFSSLAYGGDQLLASGAYLQGLVYLGGSIVLGIALARAGHLLAGRVATPARALWRQRTPARAVRTIRRHRGTLPCGRPLQLRRLISHSDPHPSAHGPAHQRSHPGAVSHAHVTHPHDHVHDHDHAHAHDRHSPRLTPNVAHEETH